MNFQPFLSRSKQSEGVSQTQSLTADKKSAKESVKTQISFSRHADTARLRRHLKALIAVIGLSFFIGALMAPEFIWAAALIMGGLIHLAYGLLRLKACMTQINSPAVLHHAEAPYPTYAALVPIYQEAHMVQPLMSALEALDYPHDKLRILMICEADDTETILAVKKYLRPPFECVIVPPGPIKTKPRALNYALQSVQTDIVTIYDAEDRPPPRSITRSRHGL